MTGRVVVQLVVVDAQIVLEVIGDAGVVGAGLQGDRLFATRRATGVVEFFRSGSGIRRLHGVAELFQERTPRRRSIVGRSRDATRVVVGRFSGIGPLPQLHELLAGDVERAFC